MNRKILTIVLVIPLLFTLAGCAGMTTQQQRMLSGGAIGAGAGAVIGAAAGGNPAAGAAIGGAAGVIGGAIYDDLRRDH